MNIATISNFDPVARAMAALPDGHYWIKLSGNADAWEIGELRDGVFWACGSDVPMRPGNVADIGDMVKRPSANPNPPEVPGDYWVRRTRESAWLLGSWIGGHWWFHGIETGCRAEAVAVVGPKIEKPEWEYDR